MTRYNAICPECPGDKQRFIRPEGDKPGGFIDVVLCKQHSKTLNVNPELRIQNRGIELAHGCSKRKVHGKALAAQQATRL